MKQEISVLIIVEMAEDSLVSAKVCHKLCYRLVWPKYANFCILEWTLAYVILFQTTYFPVRIDFEPEASEGKKRFGMGLMAHMAFYEINPKRFV